MFYGAPLAFGRQLSRWYSHDHLPALLNCILSGAKHELSLKGDSMSRLDVWYIAGHSETSVKLLMLVLVWIKRSRALSIHSYHWVEQWRALMTAIFLALTWMVQSILVCKLSTSWAFIVYGKGPNHIPAASAIRSLQWKAQESIFSHHVLKQGLMI